jgi:hypothetical protein
MGRHHSTRNFFRQVPNRLPAMCFRERGQFADLDFVAMKKTNPDALSGLSRMSLNRNW